MTNQEAIQLIVSADSLHASYLNCLSSQIRRFALIYF